MRKRILSSFMAVCMIFMQFTGVPARALAANAAGAHQNHKVCFGSVCGDTSIAGDNVCSHEEETWEPWSFDTSSSGGRRVKTYKTDGTFYLMADITLGTEGTMDTNPIIIKDGETLNLCLNGHTITMEYSGRPIFTVNRGGTLNLCDCQGSGTLTGAAELSGNKGAIYSVGTFHMYGGMITGNKAASDASSTAGGVSIGDTTTGFRMYGGKISGNEGTGGGGIRCMADFHMYGGEISGNKALNSGSGGGAALDRGTYYLYGGRISGNTAENAGGGISTNSGELNLYGGLVSNNTASKVGGGIYSPSCTINLRGGEITDNTASDGSGGGIYANNSANVNVYAGSVTGNQAKKSGGGIFFDHGNVTFDGKSDISGNTRDDGSADNVFLNGSVVSIGENFDTASTIGIHKSSSQTINCSYNEKMASNVKRDVSAGFSSDTEDAHIELSDGTLMLMGNHNYSDAYSRDENSHWHQCERCDAVTGKEEHSWDGGAVTTEPTDETEGVRTYTCTACSWTRTESIAKTGFSVTLHTNGGSGGTNLTKYTYGKGAVLPADWTKTGYTFAGWYGNENFTGEKVTDIPANAAGDKEYWAKWTDDVAPVIGALEYSYQPKNLWQWLIGKDSLTITVPVTEEGSGADEITYTVTPDGGTPESKTANIAGGKAEITLSADFKGTVSIACTDKANNTSASVTVGAGIASNGIIIEDHAPQISFQPKNGGLLQSGTYQAAPDIDVTVADNKDDACSGGIASVSYKIGSGGENKVGSDSDYTANMVLTKQFTIPASEIPAGETVLSVTAADHAGNSTTQVYTVNVHIHSGTLVPAVEPTCTTAGNKEYYICSCGKEFDDSGCTDEITDHTEVIKNALGHDFTGKYLFDTEKHWKKCSRCSFEQLRGPHVYDNASDTDCNVCGYSGTIESSGNVSKDVEKDEKAPDTALSDSAEELSGIILTEEEKGQIGNGTDIKFILNVKDAGDTVSSGDRAAVQSVLSADAEVKGFSIGQYLDISLFKVIGDSRSAISQTMKKLTIVIHVPDSLRSKDSTKPRTYAIIRVHDGVAEVLPDLDHAADTITIATDRFSAYAIVYQQAGGGTDVTPDPAPGGNEDPGSTPGGNEDPGPSPGGNEDPGPSPGGNEKPDPAPGENEKPDPSPGENEKPDPAPGGAEEKASGEEIRKIEIHSGLRAIQTETALQILWGRVRGADGYDVYVQYCGKDFSDKSLNQVLSGKKTKITVKKINGKKLDTKKNYKLYVVAWQWKNGKKSTLARTLTIHIAGKDSKEYTNVKEIQIRETSYTLKKGAAITLRPKAVLYDKRKKQLSAGHCKEFRYLSSNQKVAVVTADGKIKAKGAGECTIYIFAKNGCRRKIEIKVKE